MAKCKQEDVNMEMVDKRGHLRPLAKNSDDNSLGLDFVNPPGVLLQ